MFRRGDQERMLFTSNHMAIGGTAFLALAIAAAVFVITDVLFGAGAGALVAALAALALAAIWYVLPLWRRLQETR